MITTNFKITNLTCEACVKLSTMALKKIPGVSNVAIDLKSGIGNVESDNPIEWNAVVEALQKVEKKVEKV